MKIFMAAFLLMICATSQAEPIADEETSGESDSSVSTVCVMKGSPRDPGEYDVVRDVKAGKNSYGSVTEVMPELVRRTVKVGANTIIFLNSSQRFGFWPWRVVRPVAYGQAVIWHSKTDSKCVEYSGQVFQISEAGGAYEITSRISNEGSLLSGEDKQESADRGGSDLYTQLTKLEELRQMGIITEEEFQTEKKEILDKY